MPPTRTTLIALATRYDAFLLDAYGTLVHGTEVCPGAGEALRLLDRLGKRWLLLTNDASKLSVRAAVRYQSMGLPITPDHIVNPLMLLPDLFTSRALVGARCRVLGPPDSCAYVTQAGGVVAALDDPAFDVLVVCDESGYPFLETLDATLTDLAHLFAAGLRPVLLLPNPDLTFTKDAHRLGFAAGTLARMLSEGLHARFPDRPAADFAFQPLGKPHLPMYARALDILRTSNVVVVGDQLATDIRGGRDAGLDTALVTWGVSRWQGGADDGVTPDWLLESW
jgi:ribonucleotide monophosphatase NagD (HAD superfamily)